MITIWIYWSCQLWNGNGKNWRSSRFAHAAQHVAQYTDTSCCIVPCCTAPCCIVPCCTAPCCVVQCWTSCCTVPQYHACTISCCIVPHCIAPCCIVQYKYCVNEMWGKPTTPSAADLLMKISLSLPSIGAGEIFQRKSWKLEMFYSVKVIFRRRYKFWACLLWLTGVGKKVWHLSFLSRKQSNRWKKLTTPPKSYKSPLTRNRSLIGPKTFCTLQKLATK